MSQPITDDVLLAAQAGDGEAFRVIYKSLSPAVFSYLNLKGVTDAEAVTSDVFLALFPRLPNVTGGPAGLRTLVFSIAHARMVDEHRRRARAPELVEFDAALDDRSSPAAEVVAADTLGTQRVVQLLARLTLEQREVLVLRIIADLTVEQTAAVLEKTEGAVKQLQRRGLLTLRELLSRRDVTL